jgi:hypothetical protein
MSGRCDNDELTAVYLLAKAEGRDDIRELRVEIERLREALRFLLSVQNAKWVPSEHVDEWLDAVQQSHTALFEECDVVTIIKDRWEDK